MSLNNLTTMDIAWIREEIIKGNYVNAVKYLRNQTKLGLKEAKDAIDYMRANGKLPDEFLSPKDLSEEQKRIYNAVDYLKGYINTYDNQIGYLDYTEETLIKDILYGIGAALSPDYKMADGFERFKMRLQHILTPMDIADLETHFKNEGAGTPKVPRCP